MKLAKNKPLGWLREYLVTQKQGLTGHMEKAGYPFDRRFWGEAEPRNENSRFWWPFEQTAYHIDGYVRTAILLGDSEMLAKAADMIYPALDAADENGSIGHERMKESADDCEYWPQVIFFRACLALYSYNKDKKIIEALTKHYLSSPTDYSKIRNLFNAEIMILLYKINGEEKLLELAVKSYEKGKNNDVQNTLSRVTAKAHIHGVTYNEYAKLGALLYSCTGEKRYLEDSVKAYEKILRLYMLPCGCNSSSEYMLNNRYDETYETCDIADMTWSLHYLAEICDDTKYSDMIEKCIFNAGIGSVTEDFRALQYFSCANQIVLDETSSHCRYDMGGKSMAYSPMPFTACCPGNVNRIMPNFALSMWSLEENCVTARMYGPCEFSGEIDGKAFSVTEKTNYPFDLKIDFEIKTEAPLLLRLRVPEWSNGIGGAIRQKGITIEKAENQGVIKNGFMLFNVTEDVEISIEFSAKTVQKENHGGVYFERGPLVYSLGMFGKRKKSGDADFPTYKMYADQKWNYAVVGDGAPQFLQGTGTKWDLRENLPSITVSCREVENWHLRRTKKLRGISWKYEPKTIEFENPVALTPRLPAKSRMKLSPQIERVTLYPYGACKLRMTVLPKIDK
ncbi:MAG: glycoside hydrolase family 127 protein [Clostridia bacterium]|nr:glycoside hydrolase family 127 protein [Clostridia bacterium]